MDNLFKEIKKQLFNRKIVLIILLTILVTAIGTTYLSDSLTFILQILPSLTVLIIELSNIKEFNKKNIKKLLKEEGVLIYSMVTTLIMMFSIKFNAIYLIFVMPLLSFFLLGEVEVENKNDK